MNPSTRYYFDIFCTCVANVHQQPARLDHEGLLGGGGRRALLPTEFLYIYIYIWTVEFAY